MSRVLQVFKEHIAELRVDGNHKSKDTNVYQAAIDDLAAKRKHFQDGFKDGIFDQNEAVAAIHEIDIRLEVIESKIQEGQQLERSRMNSWASCQPWINS